jgi:predicted neutral ceramidase superfamily lipid hydrolase
MTEPAVTLTDYALALECAVFVIALIRLDARDRQLCFWFVLFFASAGAASVFGGTVHGFFLAASSPGRRLLWPATIFAILVTSLAAWNIGAVLQLGERRAILVRRLAVAQLVILSFVVLFVTSKFYVGIIAYLPSTLFLLFVLLATDRRGHNRAIRWGVAGLALTLAAAAVQQLHISIHPVYFNHNALYHVIQGAALGMIFVAARSISRAWPPIRRNHAIKT